MICLPRILPVTLLLGVSLSLHAAPTGLLNDTGQGTCYDGANLGACDTANSGDSAAYPRQDGRFGRDAAAAAGQLAKTGAGAAGFDYTRMCFNGDPEGSGTCTGALVANTTDMPTGAPSSDWACTKDNVTNLVWSLQSGNGEWTTYARTTLPAATNAATRCGYSDGWRLPTRRELLSLVHHGVAQPSIDSAYFPDTQSFMYWSADPYVPYAPGAWFVNFNNGGTGSFFRTNPYYVRIVRSGQ